MAHDLLGRELTDTEAAVLAAYDGLKALLERDDLAPCTRANIAESLACLWQAVNELALTDDRPDI